MTSVNRDGNTNLKREVSGSRIPATFTVAELKNGLNNEFCELSVKIEAEFFRFSQLSGRFQFRFSKCSWTIK